MKQGTGSLWRIRRSAGIEPGELPPPSVEVPFYPIQAAIVGGGIAGTIALVRRLLRSR